MRIGYARVSTEDQCLDLQIDALRCAGCDAIFQDQGVSAVAECRPGLAQALSGVAAGDVLVTWRFDRLARSLHDLMNITASLHVREAGLVSLSEHIDTASPAGRLVLHIFGAVAEFERSLIIERTKAGLASARRRGARIGRKPALSPDQVAEAALMIERGSSVRDAARVFSVGTSTLHRYLRCARTQESEGFSASEAVKETNGTGFAVRKPDQQKQKESL